MREVIGPIRFLLEGEISVYNLLENYSGSWKEATVLNDFEQAECY